MKEPIKVYIAELADRYLVLNAENGDNMDDDIGFSSESWAREFATNQGFEIVDSPR